MRDPRADAGVIRKRDTWQRFRLCPMARYNTRRMTREEQTIPGAGVLPVT